MSYIPADPAFYERILAALDKHPFAATLVYHRHRGWHRILGLATS